MKTDPKRQLLRHTLATLAYRPAKAVRDSPAKCESFKVSDTSRTPVQILAQLRDLMGCARSIADGSAQRHHSKPLPWPVEAKPLLNHLAEFDADADTGDTPLHLATRSGDVSVCAALQRLLTRSWGCCVAL